jgi:hypothetical protein
VDHPEAGVLVRRVQAFAAAVVAVLLVGAAAYADRELGTNETPDAGEPSVASGEWFCPHGGGEEGWEIALQVANPGDTPATIRVRTLGPRRPGEAQTLTVAPGSLVRVDVPADGRARSSMVEWFDQWVAVGWVARAGGDEGGVAAEPCASSAGDRWFLPDGTTENDENDDSIVVMNPFARNAVLSVVLLSERSAPVVFGELTDIVLRPFRSRAIPLDEIVEGERTVSALVEVSVGRVVAGSVGITRPGALRSSLGYLGAPPPVLAFPGGADAGRTDLAVMNAGLERASIAADLLSEGQDEQPFAGIAESAQPSESGRTFPATTSGPTTVVFDAGGPDVAATRRAFGVRTDEASTIGATPAEAWIVLPAVAAEPWHPGLVLANPGSEPADVVLSLLSGGAERSITVPPRVTVAVPPEFVEASPEDAVIAVATTGTFIPAAASYSLGLEGFGAYAVAVGIPVPPGWVPA